MTDMTMDRARAILAATYAQQNPDIQPEEAISEPDLRLAVDRLNAGTPDTLSSWLDVARHIVS